MTRKTLPVALGTALLLFASGAEAGPGDYVGNGVSSLQRLSPVERTQYSSSGSGNAGSGNDCWDLYQINCPVPRFTNPIQDLAGHSVYPGAPNHDYRGAPAAGLSSGGAPVYPGRQNGGAPALHDFGGAGAGLHGLGSGGVPASPGFTADAPAFHAFGGAEGFHGFGGAAGFHGGGGGAFSVGGRGGIGHR